ncbi:MAG: ParA family protein [Desulfuromonadaceae bacterium]|nr:ParA family protein [Desulfuromonadaceae bacterium]
MTTDPGRRQYPLLTTRELAAKCGTATTELERRFKPDELLRLNGATNGITPQGVRRFLEGEGVSYRFRVIAHTTMRGGIGKTTSTISTAVRAAQYGFKTCVLDLDPQGSSSMALGAVPAEDDPIFYDIWKQPEELLADALVELGPFLSILPSALENALLDASLLNPGSQKKAVKGVCQQLRIQGFDTVILDCPPSLGIAVISAICAADTVVVPVGSDAFSLKGLDLTLGEIHSICDTFGLPHPAARILYTRYDQREKVSRNALVSIRERYPALPLTVIRTSSEFSKVLAAGETIFSRHAKSGARDDYDRYVSELMGICLEAK